MIHVINASQVLALSILLGSQFWATFLGGILAFKVIPRESFGRLQAKSFPAFFKLALLCCTILALDLYLTDVNGSLRLFGHDLKQQYVILVTSLLHLINMLFEPTVTRVMYERHKLDREDASKDRDAKLTLVKKRFGILHGISALINLFAFFGIVTHALYIADRLM